MICQFKRLIYPRSKSAGDNSYMIALYRPCEDVLDSAGRTLSEIKVVATACLRQKNCGMTCKAIGAGQQNTVSSLKWILFVK